MKERQILFTGDMVRAILEGRKTITRRLLKPQPEESVSCISYKGGNWSPYPHKIVCNMCPYGVPRDRLWVKETHAIANDIKGFPYLIYKSDCNVDDSGERVGYWKGEQFFPGVIKWSPSIHLPRLSSRITLEITNVRVERVREITDDDSAREGIVYDTEAWLHGYTKGMKKQFANLWNSLYPGSWERNDWVWVIEFKIVEATR